ncbi:UNKNOWN [Stylonychia lemnae]|uniref:Uncharacterized protein n=1 Tax=Stylonychia lemnae TaxID=5949 RepID=A0A078AKA0_STYLE|nr:UNKNOWN [Stylonychia lemnae]|eukprot:CDW82614.1 UNKNOWN [Stylonychia lemnae]
MNQFQDSKNVNFPPESYKSPPLRIPLNKKNPQASKPPLNPQQSGHQIDDKNTQSYSNDFEEEVECQQIQFLNKNLEPKPQSVSQLTVQKRSKEELYSINSQQKQQPQNIRKFSEHISAPKRSRTSDYVEQPHIINNSSPAVVSDESIRKKQISSADRFSSKRESYFENDKMQELQKKNEILLNKLMGIMKTNSKSRVQQFQNKSYQIHQEQIMHTAGFQRKQQLESIMRQNFKMLERIHNQKSEYSVNNLGAGDLTSRRLNKRKKQQNSTFQDLRDIVNQSKLNNFKEDNNNQNTMDEEDDASMQLKRNKSTGDQLNSKQFVLQDGKLVRKFLKNEEVTFLPKISEQIEKFNKRIFDIETKKKLIGQTEIAKKILQDRSESQTKIVTNISMQYERGLLRKHYIELKQVFELPQDRKVLMQQQAMIKGKKGEYLVEISKTKHKYYITAVKIRDHNKYKVIEYNTFKFEKVYRNLNSDYNMVVKLLEFVSPEIMVIRDFDKLLAIESQAQEKEMKVNYSQRDQQSPSMQSQQSQEILLGADQIQSRHFKVKRQQKSLDNIDQDNKSKNIKNDTQFLQKNEIDDVIDKINQKYSKFQNKMSRLNPEQIQSLNTKNLIKFSSGVNSKSSIDITQNILSNNKQNPHKKQQQQSFDSTMVKPGQKYNNDGQRNVISSRSIMKIKDFIKVVPPKHTNLRQIPLKTIEERVQDEFNATGMAKEMANMNQQRALEEQFRLSGSRMMMQDSLHKVQPEMQDDEEPSYPKNIRRKR